LTDEEREARESTRDAELAQWGMTRDDVAADLADEEAREMALVDVDVWPDCWDAALLFVDCMTQWRASMSGFYGLDYAGVLAAMEMKGVKRKARPQLFADIRVMEGAALETMRGNE
jgi:hypothetical protein